MASEVPDDARTEAGTPCSRSRNVGAHRRCGSEVSIGAGEVNERPPDLAWARAPCLRWVVGSRLLRSCLVQSEVQARLPRLLVVSDPKYFRGTGHCTPQAYSIE